MQKNWMPKYLSDRRYSLYLREMLNITPLQQRLEMAQVKLWNYFIRAPSTLLKSKIINDWRYRYNKNGNINENISEYVLRNRKIKHIVQKNNNLENSTITSAYNLINSLNQLISQPVKIDGFELSLFKPPPMYGIDYPKNIEIYPGILQYNQNIKLPVITINKIKKSKYNKKYINIREKSKILSNELMVDQNLEYRDDSLEFFIDGSCKPNPGPGGTAVQKKSANKGLCIKRILEANFPKDL